MRSRIILGTLLSVVGIVLSISAIDSFRAHGLTAMVMPLLITLIGLAYLLYAFMNRPGKIPEEESEPDKVFRKVVRPIALVLIFHSIMMLMIISTKSDEVFARLPVPFFPDAMKQFYFIAGAVISFGMGVGLFIRSRAVWILFIGYLSASSIHLLLGVLFDTPPGLAPKWILFFFAALVSGTIVVGLYGLTKPAFEKR